MTAADEDKIKSNADAHRLTVRDDAIVFTRAAYEARVIKNFSCRDQYGSSFHGQSIPVAAPIAPVSVSLPPNHVEIEFFKNAELGRDSPLTEILTSFHLADLNPCCFGWCFPKQTELPTAVYKALKGMTKVNSRPLKTSWQDQYDDETAACTRCGALRRKKPARAR